jgi:hypothetical protein
LGNQARIIYDDAGRPVPELPTTLTFAFDGNRT